VTNAEGFSAYQSLQIRVVPASTFGGGYNFANFAGSLFGFSGSSDASFLGSGAASGGFTGSADGRTGFTGSADSASRKPLLYAPSGVAVDASGNIYVSDSANNQVRKISTNGAIQNLAGVFTGSGGEDGTKWNARFNNPQGMASDTSGNIYVADQDNHAIRKVTPAGAVSMVAGSFTGSGAAGFSGSADGGGKTTARFNKPSDVAVDAAGNIYVADSGNHAIRKISTNGTVTTLAGTMGAAGNINASGANARFRTPQGIAVDANGTVYVADTGNQVIRRITANGAVSTFAGAAFTGSASPLGGRASFTGSAHAAFIGSADSTNLPASVDGNPTNNEA
jgi:streptogramin lyase